MKTCNILLICALASATGAQKTWAEGGDKRPRGALGVNRRVVTQPGYTEVDGNFTINCQLPINPAGTVTTDSNDGIGGNGTPKTEWRGVLDDRPEFYLGGWQGLTHATDMGISWGHKAVDFNTATDAEIARDRRNHGWRYILFASTPTISSDHARIYVWDPAITSGERYRVHFSSFARPLSGSLYNRIYEGDDPNTTVREAPGMTSLSVRFWNSRDPQGVHTVFFLTASPTLLPSPPGQYDGTIASRLTVPVTQADVDAGVSQITVADARGFEPNQDLEIGAEVRRVSLVSGNLITLTRAIASIHNLPTEVSQTLNARRPYPSHPVAPWAGEPVFDPARLAETQMRRVVAMTRSTPATDQLDGSWLQCRFENGRIKQQGANQTLQNWLYTEPNTLPFADTDRRVHQGTNGADEQVPPQPPNAAGDPNLRTTGYDARPNMPADSLAQYDARWRDGVSSEWNLTPGSRTIVDFPSLIAEARRNTPASRRASEATGLTRYQRETVHINLKRVARPIGDELHFEAPVPAS